MIPSSASIAMKEILMDSDAPYLPQEIITNIFKRLPVKSIIRFRCVCEDWKNLFKTPSFIAEHLHHSTQQNPCLLFERGDNKCNAGLINRDMQVLEFQTRPFIDSSMGSCRIVHSSNGLLCLELTKSESYFLWNPAIREVLQVPKDLNLRRPMMRLVGFGFSPIVNDFKIVRLFVATVDCNHLIPAVEVFSLSTRSWKEVEFGKLEGIFPYGLAGGLTFDGAIFWFGIKQKLYVKEDEIRCHLIFSFDIATESLTLIPFPSSAPILAFNRLTTYENKLAMLSNTMFEDIKSSSIDLWVIEKCVDASGERWIWTKIYTSNLYPALMLPQTIWRNEIFCEFRAFKVLDNDEEKHVLCNLHTNEFKMLAIGKYPIRPQFWNYAENLVSVGNIHIGPSSS